jgi:hypothetical protein
MQEEKRLVLGVVLQPNVPDSDDDVFSEEVIEDAMTSFNLSKSQSVDLEHLLDIPDAAIDIVESYLAPADFELDGEKITKGTWLMKFRVNSEPIWEAVKEGLLTGLSPAGKAMVDLFPHEEE